MRQRPSARRELAGLQSRRAESEETRRALTEASERVAVLARSRSALLRDRRPLLETALRQVCEALHAQAEPRSVAVSLRVDREPRGLLPAHTTAVALVVNELATNAIKHAFEESASGQVRVAIGGNAGGDIVVTVDDDGLPFPAAGEVCSDGLGLELAKRLMASVGGLFIPPPSGSKVFELRVPIAAS